MPSMVACSLSPQTTLGYLAADRDRDHTLPENPSYKTWKFGRSPEQQIAGSRSILARLCVVVFFPACCFTWGLPKWASKSKKTEMLQETLHAVRVLIAHPWVVTQCRYRAGTEGPTLQPCIIGCRTTALIVLNPALKLGWFREMRNDFQPSFIVVSLKTLPLLRPNLSHHIPQFATIRIKMPGRFCGWKFLQTQLWNHRLKPLRFFFPDRG